MKKLIALIAVFVTCTAGPVVWLNNKFQKELKLNEELRQYRKLQADLDIQTLQAQLSNALVANVRPSNYQYDTAMQRQMEILNRMYQRI